MQLTQISVDEYFEAMHSMLRDIQANIRNYPIEKQHGFIMPLKYVILEAHTDSNNENDSYLNSKT